MINEISNMAMTLKQALKTVFYIVLAVCFLIGMGVFVYTASHSENNGRFTSEDMKEFYDLGYKDGAENMRQACLREYTDTTVTCHEGFR